jgi:surfactin synthase thioesterase subunit
VSCAYLENAYAQPTGRELFEDLAQANAHAQFYLFHGTQDWNASVEPVRDLERWAQTQQLALRISYYEGGHNDPPQSTRQEVSSLVNSLTEHPGQQR